MNFYRLISVGEALRKHTSPAFSYSSVLCVRFREFAEAADEPQLERGKGGYGFRSSLLLKSWALMPCSSTTHMLATCKTNQAS